MTLLAPLWLLICVLLAVTAVLSRLNAEGDDWGRIITRPVLAFLRPGSTRALRRFSLPLAVAAIAAAALANPARLAKDSETLRAAEGWIVALDVSKSMEKADIAPSRLSAARDTAGLIIERAQSRPVALILYAGDAYLAAPFSFDKQQLRDFLKAVKPRIVPVPGSDPKRALAFASRIVEESGTVQARVFLLSDAPQTANDATEPAAALARQGHRVDVIDFADPGMQPPEVPDTGASKRIAAAGNGGHIAASAMGTVDTETLFEPDGFGGGSFIPAGLAAARYASLSHWIALLAMPLLLLMFARRKVA